MFVGLPFRVTQQNKKQKHLSILENMVLHPSTPGGGGGYRPMGTPYHGFNPRYPMIKPPRSGPIIQTQAALLSAQAAQLKTATANGETADFDGKRPRKSLMRKTVDYNSAFLRMIEQRVWQRGEDRRDRRALQPDVVYYPELLPPLSYPDNPANAVTTKFVKTATNKMRCPIFTLGKLSFTTVLFQ